MASKNDKIQRSSVMTIADLDGFEGTVKNLRHAWDHLPDDIDQEAREMFIELTGKVLAIHNKLKDQEKDKTNLN